MKSYGPDDIRNIVLLGHQSSGKTSLGQAILYVTGTLNRLERVEDGNSCLDFEEEEIERKMSLNAAVGYGEWRKQKINFVDTPGFDDFAGEQLAGLSVVEGAVVVIKADSGVEVGTEKIWELLNERSFPRLIFLSRMDKEHADYPAALAQIGELLPGASAVPFQVPLGQGEQFRGFVDLIHMKAYLFDAKGVPTPAEIPAELQDEVDELRSALVEGAAEADEQLMEKFFAEGSLTDEEVIRGLSTGVRAGTLAPVLLGDAHSGRGVRPLLDAVVDFMPSPVQRPLVLADGGHLAADPDGKPAALIFKNTSEMNLGDLYFLRVFAGTLEPGKDVYNLQADGTERLSQLYLPVGKNRTEIERLGAGELGMVMKLKHSKVGDCLGSKGDAPFTQITFPRPSIEMAIEAVNKADEEKIGTGLGRLQREDPTFNVHFDGEIKQNLIAVQGDTHMDVVLSRLKRKFKVAVATEKPRIAYKETIKKLVDSHYRHKKQTGGRGQFGDVYIKFEPLPRGGGFEFVDAITGGVIPGKFIPAVEKGVREAMVGNGVSGYPVVDVKATLHFGSYHNVDSDEHSFKLAGAMALKEGIREAGAVLLEPIQALEIKVPDENLGDIMGDVSGRRGKIQGTEKKGRYQVVKATAPLSELYKYATQLRSISGGRGSFTMAFSHYEEMPHELAQRVIDEAEAARTES